MMIKRRCFEKVSDSIKDFDKQSGIDHIQNENKLRILQSYCKAIDDIMDEFETDVSYADIDPYTFNTILRFESTEIIIRDMILHPFVQLMDRSISMCIYHVSRTRFGVEFVFPSVFD